MRFLSKEWAKYWEYELLHLSHISPTFSSKKSIGAKVELRYPQVRYDVLEENDWNQAKIRYYGLNGAKTNIGSVSSIDASKHREKNAKHKGGFQQIHLPLLDAQSRTTLS